MNVESLNITEEVQINTAVTGSGHIESVQVNESSNTKLADKGVVYATVVIENSPSSKIQNVSMVGEIIDCKDHLKRNILDIKFGKLRSWSSENARFRHEVPAVLQVDTRSLWESSRTYNRKHLGNDSWTLQDGTIVSFLRIHHK